MAGSYFGYYIVFSTLSLDQMSVSLQPAFGFLFPSICLTILLLWQRNSLWSNLNSVSLVQGFAETYTDQPCTLESPEFIMWFISDQDFKVQRCWRKYFHAQSHLFTAVNFNTDWAPVDPMTVGQNLIWVHGIFGSRYGAHVVFVFSPTKQIVLMVNNVRQNNVHYFKYSGAVFFGWWSYCREKEKTQ